MRNAWAALLSRTLCVSLALSGWGCGDRTESLEEIPALPPVAESERFGGTAVVGGAADVATVNPAATTGHLAAELQKHVLLMTLLRHDSTMQAEPYLAESWELNQDSTQVVFHLRRDVRWHDGVSTTARDVAFTFERLKEPRTAFPNREWFDQWEGAEVLDPYTIRFVLRPHAGFLYGWTQLPIMPAHLLGDVGPEELGRDPFGTEAPVGNGPFRFVERLPGDRWVFEANEGFPNGLGGRPYLDRLVYKAVPDEATLFAELRTGSVHMLRDLPPSQIERIEADPDLAVLTFPIRSYTFIVWNGQRPVFRDAAVRRALTMAIDRPSLVGAVRNGLGRVANGPIGPWHWAYEAELAPLAYDPEGAAALLDSLGWTDSDGDGVRDRAGNELSFELSTNDRQVNQDISVIVQSQLRAIGVEATPSTRESGALAAALTSPERRFDAVVLAWDPDFEVDDRPLFACSHLGEIFQFASYCNRELDPVLDSIPMVRDRPTRLRLYRKYNRIVQGDQPFTFLYFTTDAVGVRRELQGLVLDARGEFTSVRDWWVHPDYRAANGSP
jgi:peptide/nickel transport system substrate-binding protein